MKQLFFLVKEKIERLRDLPPLFFRIILSYGFFEPAVKKLTHVDDVAAWFASMNYPFPTLNVYLSGLTELTGSVLLLIGFATRVVTLPLMFVMFIAIATVHLGNGFEAANNGFEIPLYYLLMLFSLLVSGPGRLSLDHLISSRLKKD